jgi:hypothetical protein
MTRKPWRPRTRKDTERLLAKHVQPRRMDANFVVPNLLVTRPWRVGQTIISPGGWVLRRAEADFAAGRIGELTVEDYRRHLGGDHQ